MKQCVRKLMKSKHHQIKRIALISATFGMSVYAYAGGNEGLDQATSMMKGYFESGVNLVYAASALVGLVGAVKVFVKWNSGHPDVGSTAAAWFGSCIFIAIVATVLKSFFGL